MKLVILESPYMGQGETPELKLLRRTRNVLYARAAVRHSLLLGECPIASHLLYTQKGVLVDSIAEERDLGMKAGAAWRVRADYTVFYTDFGFSAGMYWAKGQVGIMVERKLPKEFWSEPLLNQMRMDPIKYPIAAVY